MLSIILEALMLKNIITQNEAEEIHSLSVLTQVLESKLIEYLTPNEKMYLDKINVAIKNRKFNELKLIMPPKVFKSMHKKLLRLTSKLIIVGEK